MRPGDRIAIKAAYTRKNDLPFDNRGHTVSVMAIKAIGTIMENLNDGRHVRVDWKKLDPVREWYFYTNRGTVWQVLPGEWMPDGLIAFAFDGKPQDIDRFRNEPFWRERFGSVVPDGERFAWTNFYEAIATKLLRAVS
jgi:5-methylcytosine-specific restriction protein B